MFLSRKQVICKLQLKKGQVKKGFKNQDVHNYSIISDTFDLSFVINKMSSHFHTKTLMIPTLCMI